jgi:hypothetical protein
LVKKGCRVSFRAILRNNKYFGTIKIFIEFHLVEWNTDLLSAENQFVIKVPTPSSSGRRTAAKARKNATLPKPKADASSITPLTDQGNRSTTTRGSDAALPHAAEKTVHPRKLPLRELTAEPLHDAAGAVVEITCTSLDVTGQQGGKRTDS